MLRAIIVDDERQCSETLQNLIEAYCPQVQILASCFNIDDAQFAILKHNPDIVFLDVEMPGGSGFDLLTRINPVNFEVIFTTAHDEYAVRAIRFSALDFLLKPIGREDLVEAVNRASVRFSRQQVRIETLIHNINLLNKDKRIGLPTFNGIEFVPISDIVRCEGDNNYTVFHLQDKSKIMVSKTLKGYEDLLGQYQFFRVHLSHLINLRYVKSFSKDDGGIITMTDNTTVEVSRRKKEEFLKRIAEM